MGTKVSAEEAEDRRRDARYGKRVAGPKKMAAIAGTGIRRAQHGNSEADAATKPCIPQWIREWFVEAVRKGARPEALLAAQVDALATERARQSGAEPWEFYREACHEKTAHRGMLDQERLAMREYAGAREIPDERMKSLRDEIERYSAQFMRYLTAFRGLELKRGRSR